MTIGIILVAAGLSQRFRQRSQQPAANKLMAICRGLTDRPLSVFAHTLRNIRQATDNIVVVTRPDYHAIKQQAELFGCQTVSLESEGLGDSIAAGVAQTPAWQGWLIALADMPFIMPQTFTNVIQAVTSENIVRPVYQQRFGHPVGFGSSFKQQLMMLNGSSGARSLLNLTAPVTIEVNDAGILRDIDLPEDLF